MTSNYIDSILPKYQPDSSATNLVNYNNPTRSMYPSVSVTSHQLASNAAYNMFSGMAASTDSEKACRYSQTAATDMSQYGLNQLSCATSSNMAQYFHQNNTTNPLNSCSQPTAPTPHLPDIPRYPWMSITGRSLWAITLINLVLIKIMFMLFIIYYLLPLLLWFIQLFVLYFYLLLHSAMVFYFLFWIRFL